MLRHLQRQQGALRRAAPPRRHVTTAYLAAEGLEAQLTAELKKHGVVPRRSHGRLLICDDSAPVSSAWAANVWHDCVEMPVASIKTASKALRGIQRNWASYSEVGHHGRAALIQKGLPHVSAKVCGVSIYSRYSRSHYLLSIVTPPHARALPVCLSLAPTPSLGFASP